MRAKLTLNNLLMRWAFSSNRPAYAFYGYAGLLAHLVERAAVNRKVVRSKLTWTVSFLLEVQDKKKFTKDIRHYLRLLRVFFPRRRRLPPKRPAFALPSGNALFIALRVTV